MFTTAGRGLGTPPYVVSDVSLHLRRTPAAVQGALGTVVLVGRLPAVAEAPWSFRTRKAVTPSTPAMEAAGLDADMLVWPIRRKGLSALQGRGLRVGRAPSNEVVLNHGDVSKLHARLMLDAASRLTLVDEGSTNGTFVNGRPVCPNAMVVLVPGDHLAFGALSGFRVLTVDTLLAALATA